mgnify:CR=1 FL=1
MQDLISQVEDLAGIEIDHTTSMVMIFGIIFLTAVVVHIILHWVVLRTFEKRAIASSRLWLQIITQNKLFHRLAFTLQGIIVNIQAVFWLQKGTEAADILTTCAQLWIMMYALLSVFSLLDVILNLAQKFPAASQLPLKGIFQGIKLIGAILVGILMISLLIGQSPAILISGLGAMAAVLMLVFKDPILGLVAGIQLSANDMVRPGDWITLPSGAANGTVQEITLNTVKIQNFDNTISTVPPYTLVSSPFQNWRGMKESGGRRVMKNITLDLTTLQFCTPEMLDRYRKEIPLMADYQPEEGVVPTNSQVYRVYIERYLCSLPVVNQDLDLIISQKEATMYGVPIQVYFFSRNKVWKEYERIQSDIFDHLLAMVPKFDLKVYQYSD